MHKRDLSVIDGEGRTTLVQDRIEFVAPVRNWKIDMRFKQVHVPHGSNNIVADLVPIRFAGIAHIQSQVPEPLRFHAISVTPLWRSATTAIRNLRSVLITNPFPAAS